MAQQHFGDDQPISAEEAMEFAGYALEEGKKYVDASASNIENYISTHEEVGVLYDKYVLGK